VLWKSSTFRGIRPFLVDRPVLRAHDASTPNTARGSGTGWNRSTRRHRSLGSGVGRRSGTLGKPPNRVRGGPQPRWPDPSGTEPAVRPPAQGCRGRAGRRGALGQRVGLAGRGTRRYRTIAGHSSADGHWMTPDDGPGTGVPGRPGRSTPSGGERNGGP